MIGLLFFFSALGAFNGILLSAYLFFANKEKKLSQYLLGALVLALSIRIGKSVLLYFDRDLPKIYLQIGLSACLFIGPFLFFYLQSVTQKIPVLPKKWKWSLLGLISFIIIAGTIRPYHTYPLFWNTYLVKSIYSVWFISVVAAGFVITPLLKKLVQSNVNTTPAERWLLVIYLVNLIIASTFFMAFFGSSMAYYISGPIVFSFFLYLAIFGYFYTDNSQFSAQKPVKKYANKKIASAEANLLLDRINHLITNQELYKNKQLKLKTLAEQSDIPAHRLSQLLNDNLGKSFNAYINEFRIKAACQLLETPHNLSLEGIGYEVGFKSKSTFFTSFKKIMHVTPAQFQQQIRVNTI